MSFRFSAMGFRQNISYKKVEGFWPNVYGWFPKALRLIQV